LVLAPFQILETLETVAVLALGQDYDGVGRTLLAATAVWINRDWNLFDGLTLVIGNCFLGVIDAVVTMLRFPVVALAAAI
jgi:hypothetical protein